MSKKRLQPNTLSQWRTGGGCRLYLSAVLMLTLCIALVCLASAASIDPPTIVNSLSDPTSSCIRTTGVIMLGWGIVQPDMSIWPHDVPQRARDILCVFDGLLIAFSKEILSATGVV